MDILSRMTTLATDIRQFQGIGTRKQGTTNSHLFFADDAMFFFNACLDLCLAVSNVPTRFCQILGQVLNLQKSFVKFSLNIPDPIQQEYKTLMRMSSHTTLGMYLGVPIDIQSNIMSKWKLFFSSFGTMV